jgi:hypothetical protein
MEDNGIVVGDGDSAGSERNVAAGIAQLAHGNEGGRGKFRHNVDVACRIGEGG